MPASTRTVRHTLAGLTLSTAALLGLTSRAAAQFEVSEPTALNTNAAVDNGFDGGVHVVTSCTGVTLAVWSSRTDLGGIGTDADIFFASSPDRGATWSAPSALNTNAGTDSGADFFPRAATDDDGHWIVVWRSHDSLGGTVGTDSDIVAARSADDGATWSAPQALAGYAATDSTFDANADISCDANGIWIAVWDSTQNVGGTAGTDQDIIMVRSTNNGVTWSTETTLAPGASSDTADDFGPSLTTDRDGHWVAAWSTYDQSSDVLTSTSSDGGLTWTTPTGLRSIVDFGQDFVARVATNRVGTWIVVWESGSSLNGSIGDDQDILFCRSTDNGASWSAPAAVGANAGGPEVLDAMPAITADHAGNWLVAWHSENPLSGTIGPDPDIVFAYSEDDGLTWSAERTFATVAGDDTGTDTNVTVATDGHGAWLTAWSSDNDLGIAAGADVDIALATVRDPLLAAAPTALNSNATTDSGTDNNPDLATDGQGNVVAVWLSNDPLGGTIGTDLDVLVARSNDGGATWSPPAPLNSNASSDSASDRNPAIATDGNGTWIAVWETPADTGGTGTDQDIFMARSTDNGQTWSTMSPVNTDATTDNESDFDPAIAADGAGNWVVTWTTDPFDTITAASTNGGASWNAPVLLAASAGDDFEPTVATDGAGLWVVAWASNHDSGGIGNDDDIMFCRSTNVGASWTSPAPLNVTAGSDDPEEDDFRPSLATDRNGNWICAWHREGAVASTWGDDSDVIVARSADNANSWSPIQAVSINPTTDSAEDSFVAASTDGAGNWLVAWASGTPALGHQSGASFDTEIACVRSTDLGASWSPAAALNRNAHADSGGDQSIALLALGEGHWLTAWNSSDDFGGQLGPDRDVLFAHAALAAPSGGPVTNLGGGCGNGGTISLVGAPAIGNPDLEVRLSGADPAAIGAALGFSVAGAPTTPCGGCIINTYYAVLGTAPVNGAAQFGLSVPCDPGLRGQTFEVQWIVGPTSQQPCSILPPISFTGRIALTLDY